MSLYGGRKENPDRTKALIEGRSKYQGAKCRRGHSGIRYTLNKVCVECAFIYAAKHKKKKEAAKNE